MRDGSFFEPVRGERFDLIATNPPFVISPATGERLVYRDSGLPGDRVVEDIVRAAPGHLTDGGWCQVLANWVIEPGPALGRAAAPAGSPDDCDALVVQREVLDPAAYVELWLKDAGQHGGRRLRAPLRHLAVLVRGAGRRGGRLRLDQPARGPTAHGAARELLEWPYDVEQPIAPAIGALGRRGRRAATTASTRAAAWSLRARRRRRRPSARAGAEDPETIVLRQQRGLRRARRADTVEAALVGACDGELTVGQILDAVAQLLDRDPAEVRETYLPVVRELVAEGFLEPAEV